MTKHEEIINLWKYLGFPDDEYLDTAKNKAKDQLPEGYGMERTFVRDHCSDLTKGKMFHTFIVNPFRRQFTVMGDNGEDEYGRGDYNTKSTRFDWDTVEEWFHQYLLLIVRDRLERQETSKVVSQNQLRIKRNASTKLNKILVNKYPVHGKNGSKERRRSG